MIVEKFSEHDEAKDRAEELDELGGCGNFCPLINAECNPKCVCHRYGYYSKDLPVEEDGAGVEYGVIRNSGRCCNPMLIRRTNPTCG